MTPGKAPNRDPVEWIAFLVKSELDAFMSVDEFLEDIVDTADAYDICGALGVPEESCEDFWTELVNEPDAISVEVRINENKLKEIAERYRQRRQK